MKRGGKLVPKSPSKSPSASPVIAPPKVAVSASKVKKDYVERPKNAPQDLVRGVSKDRSEANRKNRSEASSVSTNHAASTVHAISKGNGDGKRSATVADEASEQANDRVAELEKALSAVKEEQHMLRQELDMVRRQTQAFVEKPAKHTVGAEHHTEYVTGDRHQLNAEELFNENHELRYRYAQLQDRLVAQDAAHTSEVNQSNTHDKKGDYNDLKLRLHATEKESQERLQQLLSLKLCISSLTQAEAEVTDSELAESFTQLTNRRREWVVSNYRRSELSFHKASPETLQIVESVCPLYERMTRSDRFALYQGLVSHFLMQIFQEPVIVGLPTTGPLAAIRPFAEEIHDAEAEYRAWRRATICAIESSNMKHVLRQERDRSLHQLAGEIGQTLSNLTSVDLTEKAHAKLVGILHAAADLQRILNLQKAQYHVTFFRSTPNMNVLFKDRIMDCVNDMTCAGDTWRDRQMFFCVSPCLEKSGVEQGSESIVLSKARVSCY